jgi:hypothetical protein
MTIKMAFGCHKHMATKIVLLTISAINQNYFNHHKRFMTETISVATSNQQLNLFRSSKNLIIAQESTIELRQLEI